MAASDHSGDLTDDGHRARAEEMYERWQAGEPKSRLDIEYWDSPNSHGKKFTGYVKKWLGVATERKSAQTELVERLEARLRANGLSPADAGDLEEEFRLLAKSRESALEAVRLYNDPLAGFRTEAFIVLMVIAWNSLFQAMLERDGTDYYARDEHGKQVLVDGRPKVLETWALADLAIGTPEYRAVRENLDFFLRLRNRIAHRYLPAVDLAVTDESQAMLLNFENLLVEQFGEEAALGQRLAVPLQLSGFRNPESRKSLKKAQAQLPTDVAEFLDSQRASLPDEILESPEYAMPIFFVATTANRERSADSVVRFLRPGDLPPEAEAGFRKTTVVTKHKHVPVASGDLLRPTEVVNLVQELLPFRFTMSTHSSCWKHYKVRPATGAGEPEATEHDFCVYDRLHKGYGYTRAWVDKLVNELSDPSVYEKVAGVPPELR